MAFKGTAGKSSSGASMSKYDVEVESRLQKLEKASHDKCDGGGSGTIDQAKFDELWGWYQAVKANI